MNDIWAGLSSAFWLVVTGDPDLIEITLRSLQVSLTALEEAAEIKRGRAGKRQENNNEHIGERRRKICRQLALGNG